MRIFVVLILFLSTLSVFAQLPTGIYNSEGIVLQDNITWEADFSSASAWKSEIHYVLGYNAGIGSADVLWNWADGFGCGVQSNGNTGYVVYKFKCPENMLTGEGGSVKGSFLCAPSQMDYIDNFIFGIGKSIVPYSNDLYISNLKDSSQWTVINPSYSSPPVWTKSILTLEIPANLNEFYVVVAETGCPGRFGIAGNSGGLKVTAPMVINKIPIILWDSMNSYKLHKYNWQIKKENKLGINGIRLFDVRITQTEGIYADYQFQEEIKNTVDAGKNIGINRCAARILFRPSPKNSEDPHDYLTTQTWSDSNQMDNVISGINRIGKLLKATHINTVFFDIEYCNEYMFKNSLNKKDQQKAFKIGKEISQILQSYCPDITLILIPDYGVNLYFAGYRENSGHRAFIKGLNSSKPRIKVLVGTEKTYGDVNDESDETIKFYDKLWRYNPENNNPKEVTEFLINEIIQYKTNYRNILEGDDHFDSYCGIAAGFSPFSSIDPDQNKALSNYSPLLFSSQLYAFKKAGVKLMFDWQMGYSWEQWTAEEIKEAGVENEKAADYWEHGLHPNINEYIEILKNRGIVLDN